MSHLEFNKKELVNLEKSLKKEVLRTNRAGSFSCTTLIGCNTRKYHGLLVSPLPQLGGGRYVMLSTLDETVIQHEREFNLALHKYEGDNYEPKGHKYITDFVTNPIPTLVYGVGGVVLTKEKILVNNESRILIRYTLEDAHSETKIRFKPFLAFRNIHELSKANLDANTKVRMVDNGIASCMYNGFPELFIQCSKKCEFITAPDWYYNIEYMEEQKRGYNFKEDLFVPGYFETTIKKGESIIVSAGISEVKTPRTLKAQFDKEIKSRVPRNSFGNFLINSASQFFVFNDKETNILAGYPWLPARSRDALISLPGLLNGYENPAVYKSVLSTIFKQLGDCVYNENSNPATYADCQSDVPLWLIWTIQQLDKMFPDDDLWKQYGKQVKKILNGYLDNVNQFKVDDNGLIYNLNGNISNTWMNASVGGHPVLSRDGYVVETNALWYNAIMYTLEKCKAAKDNTFGKKWETIAEKIKTSFNEVFWNESRGYLADHVNGFGVNDQVRPSQIMACAFDYCMLDKHQIKSVLRVVEEQLMTPYGLRSLSPNSPNYKSFYRGNQDERENAAYNGSVWPWLFEFYISAMQKIQPRMVVSTTEKFLSNFENEMTMAGICSISELYHGDPPYSGKGSISFAMNTAALLKLKFMVDKANSESEI